MTTLDSMVDFDHLALYDEKIKQVIGGKADTSSLGTAASADVETTGVSSDTTTLPTTSQVKSFVEGKGYQTASDVASAISAVHPYKAAGSKMASELTSSLLVVGNVGNVWNVTTAIVIAAADKANWVENAENSYPAGTNVTVVDVGNGVYKFDALAGFVDLSGYLEASDVTIVTNEQVNSLFAS